MTDVFSRAKRSNIMSHVRSRGNKLTELALIQIFRKYRIIGWRRGVCISICSNCKQVLIRPDFVFRSKRIAIFVDGEFWHGHSARAKIPESNRAFWKKKIEGNRTRDKLQNRLLRENGWKVIRIWQFEITTPAVLKRLRYTMPCSRRTIGQRV